MTCFKKLLSLALATVLALTALVAVTNAAQFTDVPSTAPLLDAINYNVLSIDNFNGIEANTAASIKISDNDEIIVLGDKAIVTSSYGTAKVNLIKEVK